MEKRQTLLVIDGHALLHRAWHALPPLTAPDGMVVNAVYGFASILFKALKEMNPEYVAVTFDRAGPTFRHEAYKAYKATRVKQPDELYAQIPILEELLRSMDIPVYDAPGFEADDVIATIVSDPKLRQADVRSVILTGDMDTLQLVDDSTSVLTFRRGITDTVTYDENAVRERYGLSPEQMVDYKALRGDPSDNIKGVKGIGEKTATELIKEFGTLDGLYQELKKKDSGITGSVADKLRAGEKEAWESRELVTLRRDAPAKFSLKDAERGEIDRERVVAVLSKLGFKSLADRLPVGAGAEEAEAPKPGEKKRTRKTFELVAEQDVANRVAVLAKQKVIAILPATRTSDIFGGDLFALAIAGDGETGFYPLDDHRFEALRPILENPKIEKSSHDAKFLVEVLRGHGIELRGLTMDTMIASYLLSPGTRSHDLERLVFQHFGRELPEIGGGQGRLLPQTTEELAPLYAERAGFVWELSGILGVELRKEGHERLFREIELPLIPVLAEMEQTGVEIDVEFLKKMSADFGKRLKNLSTKIYKQASEEFNINSPAQLKTILFEKLKISAAKIRKTATGEQLSTAASELEKLRGSHPIIDLIFEYRELQKLLSTYVDALPALVNQKTGRVHTSYNQAVTATGRLSSSDPNLQNIPVRTELGREIRKAFVAPRGRVLVAADYSQIELRLVTVIAGDRKMLAAFMDGEDIHTRTAADIWGVSPNDVTREQRYAAKAINFGVLYGQGPRGLAESAGISFAEAKEFIDKYFLSHPEIKNYLETTKALAAKLGYVETLFGRRRYLPEIVSGMPQIRAAAERAAINMPVQGSAADLIKLAMVAVRDRLALKFPNAKLIMQVHDELVVECSKDDAAAVGRLMKETMESVHKFPVPIVVDVEIGQNWGVMRDIEDHEH